MRTFEVLGLHLGISKTEAKDTFNYWLEILGNVLPVNLLEQVEKHAIMGPDSEQKAGNKEFSRKGIFVEHVIRLVKVFWVAQQRFPLNS
jgi:hypothetical protein